MPLVARCIPHQTSVLQTDLRHAKPRVQKRSKQYAEKEMPFNVSGKFEFPLEDLDGTTKILVHNNASKVHFSWGDGSQALVPRIGYI